MFKFYGDIFKRLNVNNGINIIRLLFDDDMPFFDSYRCKCLKWKNSEIKQIEQTGGQQSYIYDYKGYKFVIHEDIDYDISFHIYNNDNVDESACIILFVEPIERFAYIHTLSAYDNCAISGMPKTRKGTLLLHMTIDFIQKRLKDRFNLQYIQLKDNSFYYCQKSKTNIDFDSLYMLTRANTWYGKYGFRPFNPVAKQLDIELHVNYKVNQKLVDAIKVGCTNLGELLKKTKLIPHNKIDKMMEIHKDTSIRNFLNIFMKKYDTSCDIFALIYRDLMTNMGLYNLHGVTYFLPL